MLNFYHFMKNITAAGGHLPQGCYQGDICKITYVKLLSFYATYCITAAGGHAPSLGMLPKGRMKTKYVYRMYG